MSNWYIEVTDKDDISQGDILLNCPVISASYGDDGIEANLNYSDVIVITQACDLENKKVDMVLLAPLLEAKDENIKKNLKEINKGRYPRYHLINEFNSENISMDFKCIDFGTPISLPLSFLNDFKKNEKYRLRLQSPYLEYTSHRFGNYYSRRGLPKGITDEEIKEYLKK